MKAFLLFLLCIPAPLLFCAQKPGEQSNDLTYLFIEACKNKTFGNLNQSAYLFERIAKIDSFCGACFFELSDLYSKTGEVTTALQYAKKAYIIDSTNYWYASKYAGLLILNKSYPQAITIYKSIVEAFGYKLEDRYMLAYSYNMAGTKKKALDILKSIELENGVSEKIGVEKYRYYLNNNDLRSAIVTLDDLVKVFPESFYLYGMLAEAYAIKGNNGKARENYNYILAKEPTNILALFSFGKFLFLVNDTGHAKTLFHNFFNSKEFSTDQKFDIALKLTAVSKGLGSIRKYCNSVIPYLVEKYDSVPKFFELAADYFEAYRDYRSALDFTNALLRRFPDNKPIWERYFFYQNILANYDSINNYSAVITSKFNDRPLLFLFSGIAAAQKNQNDNAISFFKSGLKIAEGNAELRNQFCSFIAETYYKMNKTDSAFFYYEIAIDSDAPDFVLFNNYAYYLSLREHKLIKALELSRLTIIAQPKNPTFLDTYAWICYKLKNYSDALDYIKRAYKYSGRKNSEIIDHYADIAFCNGKVALARSLWSGALKLDTGNTAISDKLKNFICK